MKYKEEALKTLKVLAEQGVIEAVVSLIRKDIDKEYYSEKLAKLMNDPMEPEGKRVMAANKIYEIYNEEDVFSYDLEDLVCETKE
jgi:hypothetical protein